MAQMSRDMWFPTMWYFDRCRFRWACAASFHSRMRKIHSKMRKSGHNISPIASLWRFLKTTLQSRVRSGRNSNFYGCPHYLHSPIQEGHEVLIHCLTKLAQENMHVVRWFDCSNMSKAVDWDVKEPNPKTALPAKLEDPINNDDARVVRTVCICF